MFKLFWRILTRNTCIIKLHIKLQVLFKLNLHLLIIHAFFSFIYLAYSDIPFHFCPWHPCNKQKIMYVNTRILIRIIYDVNISYMNFSYNINYNFIILLSLVNNILIIIGVSLFLIQMNIVEDVQCNARYGKGQFYMK